MRSGSTSPICRVYGGPTARDVEGRRGVIHLRPSLAAVIALGIALLIGAVLGLGMALEL